MVTLEHVTKRYGKKIALHDISFSMEKGKVYGLLGPNGAGKSTTMNIMTGYIGASEGTVKIGGFDIFYEAAKAKAKLGYLPEVPPLYPEMTVREYLDFVAELKGVPKKERKDTLEALMEKTGLSGERDRMIRKLSKGYRQRAGFAQALLGTPEVLILDEPTAGLDPLQIKEFNELLLSLKEEHAILISSHILSEIVSVCDHVFMIAEGELVYDGEIRDTTEAELEKLFIDRVMNGVPVSRSSENTQETDAAEDTDTAEETDVSEEMVTTEETEIPEETKDQDPADYTDESEEPVQTADREEVTDDAGNL